MKEKDVKKPMSTIEKRQEAIAALVSAENAFLVAFGWTGPDTDGNWKPPPGYIENVPPGEEHARDRGHAINSQKHRLFAYGGRFMAEALKAYLPPVDLSGDPAHETAASGATGATGPAFYLGDKDGNPVHADEDGKLPEGAKAFPFYMGPAPAGPAGSPAFYLGDAHGNPVHADADGRFPEGSKAYPFYDVKITDLSEDEVLSALAERVERHMRRT